MPEDEPEPYQPIPLAEAARRADQWRELGTHAGSTASALGRFGLDELANKNLVGRVGA